MNYIQTEIDGVWIIEPKIFFDPRGYFMEAFKQQEFDASEDFFRFARIFHGSIQATGI